MKWLLIIAALVGFKQYQSYERHPQEESFKRFSQEDEYATSSEQTRSESESEVQIIFRPNYDIVIPQSKL